MKTCIHIVYADVNVQCACACAYMYASLWAMGDSFAWGDVGTSPWRIPSQRDTKGLLGDWGIVHFFTRIVDTPIKGSKSIEQRLNQDVWGHLTILYRATFPAGKWTICVIYKESLCGLLTACLPAWLAIYLSGCLYHFFACVFVSLSLSLSLRVSRTTSLVARLHAWSKQIPDGKPAHGRMMSCDNSNMSCWTHPTGCWHMALPHCMKGWFRKSAAPPICIIFLLCYRWNQWTASTLVYLWVVNRCVEPRKLRDCQGIGAVPTSEAGRVIAYWEICE